MTRAGTTRRTSGAVTVAVAAVAAVLVAVPAQAGPRSARTVEPVDLQVPAHGAAASAISETGVVVGVAYSEQGRSTAFRWESGTAELLPDVPDQTYAVDVNVDGVTLVQSYRDDLTGGVLLWQPDGTVVDVVPAPDGGEARDLDDHGRVALDLVDGEWGDTHAAVWQNGTLTRLDDRGGTSYVAGGSLNERGDVVGTIFSDAGQRAVVWRNGVPTDLPLPAGASGSRASAVNERGDVLGVVVEGTRTRPVVWEHGRLRYLLRDETPQQSFYDLNERGTAVGQVGDTLVTMRAAAADKRGVSLLPTLGGVTSTAYAVNDAGVVVGTSSTPADVYGHAVAWVRGAVVQLGVDVDEDDPVNSVALDVDEHGRAVGYVQRRDPEGSLSFNSRALLWDVSGRS